MDPLSIPMAMFTILMRRLIDSLYKNPIPKTLSSSVISTTYPTYTMLVAAIWFFYNQLTKRGPTYPSKPLLAIDNRPANECPSIHSIHSKQCDETTLESVSEESCRKRTGVDSLTRKKGKVAACVRIFVARRSKPLSKRNKADNVSKCSSFTDYQFLTRNSNDTLSSKRTRSVPTALSGKTSKRNTKKRKLLRRQIIAWKFDGEPIAKRTRTGRVYGYMNLIEC